MPPPPVTIELGRRYDAGVLAEELIARGPVASVEIEGATVHAVTHYDELRTALTNPQLWRRGTEHWKDLQTGRVPRDHPLALLLGPTQSMLTANDADHDRQRRVLQQAFTPRRIQRLRPVIVEIVEAHLDRMAQAPGHADLKQALAWPVPVQVIAALLGLARSDWPALQRITRRIFAADASVMEEAVAFMQRLSPPRRTHPPDRTWPPTSPTPVQTA